MRKISNFNHGMLLKTSRIFFTGKRIKNTFICLVSLLLCIMQSCNQVNDKGSKKADSTKKTVKPDSPSLLPKIVYINTAKVDDEFAWKASNQKMSELEMSKLARGKGYDQQVKSLAQMITYGDSIATQTLGNLTADRKILLLADLEKNEQQILDNLKKKRGKDFDKTYVDAMINAYHKDVIIFEEATRNLKDTALKHFALQTLPVIKSNLSKCQQVSGQLR